MLTLVQPRPEDLWFKQQMMADEETMSYNHAYGGTIPFPKEKWRDWYGRWMENPDGKRYYRYLKEDSGAWIGEISYHYEEEKQIYMADVVIYAPYRQRGYGSRALEMLCAAAREKGISVLYDEIAADNPAVGLFLKHGFEEVNRTRQSVLVRKTLREIPEDRK